MSFFDGLNKDALLAIAKGDYRSAGQIYARSGKHEKALECWFKGQNYLDAAELYLEKGQFDRAGDMFANEAEFGRAGECTAKAAAAAPEEHRKMLHGKAAMFFERADKTLLAGEEHDKAGNLAKAAQYYEKGGALDKAASAHARLGDKAKAATLLEESLRQLDKLGIVGDAMSDPNQPRRLKYWRALAELYAGSGQLYKAGDFFKKVGLLDKAAEAYGQAGDKVKAAAIYVDQDNYELAARLLSGVNNPAALPLQAKISAHFGRHADAAKLFAAAGEHGPAGTNFEKAGMRAEAAVAYELAGEYLKAAKFYHETGDFAKAGEMYLQEGETAFAASMFEKAGDVTRAAQLYVKLEHTEKAALLLLNEGKKAEAVALLQKVPTDAARYREVCAVLGGLFLEANEFALAAERFEKATAKQAPSTDNLDSFYGLARALESLGQMDKARPVYETVLNFEYGYKDVKERLAGMLSAAELSASGARRAAERYQLERQLGAEGQFETWEGMDGQLSRRVKIYKITQTGVHRERLLAAGQAALVLRHPAIEEVLDIVSGPEPLIIAELPPGETLAVRMGRGPLPLADALDVARALLPALRAAHAQKILHGALSPQRISLIPGGAVKIGGFGLIERAEEQVSGRPGSSHYLTPEQFVGEKMDGRADIYLFGLVFKFMLLGQPAIAASALPWEHAVAGEPDPQLARLPPSLTAIIGRCLARKRDQRYPDVAALQADLERISLLPGMLISGRYEILKEIAAGGMGEIFQVKDRELDETVVLKILRAAAADEEIKSRFMREIKIARRITHPYVVRVFDLDRYGGNLFLTMEFVEGVPFGDFIRGGYCKDIRRPFDLAFKIAQGMEAAHQQGVIHRDLKPLNILIDRAGNPKILDFGIAKAMLPGEDKAGADAKTHAELTQAGQVIGSPKYMSPEQCQGLPADGRTDIYAFGAILYFAFTGQEPFEGDSVMEITMKQLRQTPPDPRNLNPRIPAALSRLILACLEKEKAARPGSFSELVGALGPLRQEALAAPPAAQAAAGGK